MAASTLFDSFWVSFDHQRLIIIAVNHFKVHLVMHKEKRLKLGIFCTLIILQQSNASSYNLSNRWSRYVCWQISTICPVQADVSLRPGHSRCPVLDGHRAGRAASPACWWRRVPSCCGACVRLLARQYRVVTGAPCASSFCRAHVVSVDWEHILRTHCLLSTGLQLSYMLWSKYSITLSQVVSYPRQLGSHLATKCNFDLVWVLNGNGEEVGS